MGMREEQQPSNYVPLILASQTQERGNKIALLEKTLLIIESRTLIRLPAELFTMGILH